MWSLRTLRRALRLSRADSLEAASEVALRAMAALVALTNSYDLLAQGVGEGPFALAKTVTPSPAKPAAPLWPEAKMAVQ